MTEYHLQKRTLSSWSHVTVYYDEAEGLKNLNNVHKDSGYSWRLVKVEVVQEYLLNDEKKDEVEEVDVTEVITKPIANKLQSWGSKLPEAKSGWSGKSWGTPPAVAPTHGLVGSVWLGNPTTKEKKRVPAALAESMLKEGWIKSGPRSVL